jgi:hypothetical protein
MPYPENESAPANHNDDQNPTTQTAEQNGKSLTPPNPFTQSLPINSIAPMDHTDEQRRDADFQAVLFMIKGVIKTYETEHGRDESKTLKKLYDLHNEIAREDQ